MAGREQGMLNEDWSENFEIRHSLFLVCYWKCIHLSNNFSYLWSVKKEKKIQLDFVIDKLTNSIENVQSGDSFPTEISLLTVSEIKSITKKNGWRFNWNNEIKVPQRDIFKLTIANNPANIQGIISLEVKSDHVYMHLIESAPFNPDGYRE